MNTTIRAEMQDEIFQEVRRVMNQLRDAYPTGLGFEAVLTMTLKDGAFSLAWRPEDVIPL